MDDSKIAQLKHYISRGWALVPLHDVGGFVGEPCSCRAGAACPSAGKHPRLPEWQRPEHLVRTPEALEAALQRWPSANWGLATGMVSGVGGLWAVDFDPKHADADDPATRALLALLEGCATWTQLTGSGGRHWLFVLPEDFVPNNSSGRLPAGFDVRGARRGEATGGQIVLAPSISGVGEYLVLADAEVCAAPGELLELVRPAPPKERPAGWQPFQLTAANASQAAAYVAAGINGELRRMIGTPVGQRNGVAVATARRIIELANTGLASREQAFEAWWAAVSTHPDGIVFGRRLAELWARQERHVGDRPADLSGVGGASSWGGDAVPFSGVPAAVPPLGQSGSGASEVGSVPMLGQVGDRPAAAVIETVGQQPRRVDLQPYVEGTFIAPDPAHGGFRVDGKQILYPGRWHTAIALNSAGKSWWALWHCLQEMQRGSSVVYVHFEESSPMGTIGRLRALGATNEQIIQQFIWYDTNTSWAAGEFAVELAQLETVATLVVLDGINAACSQHRWPVNDPEAVGAYRSQFVSPATSLGSSVLSLGHPPKSKDRQHERHGFGSTAWLDEVDGVGFRLVASQSKPFGAGKVGYAEVWSVKDRYGQVDRLGTPHVKTDALWHDLGALQLDSTGDDGRVEARMLPPAKDEDDPEAPKRGQSPVQLLAAVIVRVLARRSIGPSYSSHSDLEAALGGAQEKFDKSLIKSAVELLINQGTLHEVVGKRGARSGYLLKTIEAIADLPVADLPADLES